MKSVTTLLLLLVVQFAFSQEKRLKGLNSGEQSKITTRTDAIDTIYHRNKFGRIVDSVLVMRYKIDYYLDGKEAKKIVLDTLPVGRTSNKLRKVLDTVIHEQYSGLK